MFRVAEHTTNGRDAICGKQHQHFLHGLKVFSLRHVRVHFCKTGDEIFSFSGNNECVFAKRYFAAGSDRGDHATFNYNVLIFEYPLAVHRNDVYGLKDDLLFARVDQLLSIKAKKSKEQKNHPFFHSSCILSPECNKFQSRTSRELFEKNNRTTQLFDLFGVCLYHNQAALITLQPCSKIILKSPSGTS